MIRIFVALVVSYFIVVCPTLIAGFVVDDERSFAVHFGLGLFATIFTCLLYCLVITYFVITGKLIKQAVLKGDLGDEFIHRSQACKGKVMFLAVLAMGGTLVAGALGAWASQRLGNSPDRALMHLWAEITATAVNTLIFLLIYRRIYEHARLVDRVFSILDDKQPAGPSSVERAALP